MNRRGFTLIELLVVIAILGVLSTVGLVTYHNAQISARDHRRKQDLALIQQALEIYYQENHQYPISNSSHDTYGPVGPHSTQDWDHSDSGLTPWINGLNSNYINQLPIDPINSGQYTYMYDSTIPSNSNPPCPPAGQWYALRIWLENDSDPDTVSNKDSNWCNGESLQGYYYYEENEYFVVVVK